MNQNEREGVKPSEVKLQVVELLEGTKYSQSDLKSVVETLFVQLSTHLAESKDSEPDQVTLERRQSLVTQYLHELAVQLLPAFCEPADPKNVPDKVVEALRLMIATRLADFYSGDNLTHPKHVNQERLGQVLTLAIRELQLTHVKAETHLNQADSFLDQLLDIVLERVLEQAEQQGVLFKIRELLTGKPSRINQLLARLKKLHPEYDLKTDKTFVAIMKLSMLTNPAYEAFRQISYRVGSDEVGKLSDQTSVSSVINLLKEEDGKKTNQQLFSPSTIKSLKNQEGINDKEYIASVAMNSLNHGWRNLVTVMETYIEQLLESKEASS